MEQSKSKKKRAPTALTIKCSVCGAAAPDHVHFGGHCCYSCRAFFRRTLQRMEKTEIVCRTGIGQCEVSEVSKACSACRYDKCLAVGMKGDLLQGRRKKKEGSLNELLGTSPENNYDLRTETSNFASVEAVNALPETEHLHKSFDEKSMMGRDVKPYVFKQELPGVVPGVVPGVMPGVVQGVMPGVMPGVVQGVMPGIVPGIVPGSTEQDRSRQYIPEFQDISNDKKSLGTIPYKYPYTNAYSSHIPGSMPVRKVEEPNEFQYQRGHSFHGQITPKEEFNKDCFQQGLNHQSNNPNLIPKTEVVEQYKKTDAIRQPSVIQSPSSGVIRSTRTSVIQHSRSVPRRELQIEDYPRDRSQSPTQNSSTFLRYGANVMKYQADLCKQQSKVLNIQASMLEQEERARQALMSPYFNQNNLYVPSMPSYTGSFEHSQNKSIIQKARQGGSSHTVTRNDHNIQQSSNNLVENKSISQTAMPVQVENFEHMDTIRQQEQRPMEPVNEKTEQMNLKKDLKNMFDEVLHKENPSFDSKIFQSQIFKEAEDLLSNSPFNSLMASLSQDVKQQQQQRRFAENVPHELLPNSCALKADKKRPHVEIQHVYDDDEIPYNCGENQDPKKYNKISEFRVTDEEINWVDQIFRNMSICTKTMIRPSFYKAMIDVWRGVINHQQLLGVLVQGKSSQAYMHILIMANLPYFNDISSRAQRYLMKSNSSVCSELMTAYFFFGHNGSTIIEQEKTCGIVSNFTDYILREAPYAVNMPARTYDSIYKSPWAASLEVEQKHRRTQQLVGGSMRGKDQRVLPLLYALAFFAVTETEMNQIGLSVQDKETIKKAQEHLSVIYRRFLKGQHGWMAATGYALSHVYYISMMKENVKVGEQTNIHQPKINPENLVPENPMPIPPDLVKPEILKGNSS